MATVQEQQPTPLPRKGKTPAVSPRLRVLLYVVFGLAAILGANSAYLFSITSLEWATGQTYQNYFYQLMFLGHLALGLLLVVPLIVFGILHIRATYNRRQRRAIRIGYTLFAAAIGVLATGFLLMRVEGFYLQHAASRSVIYWLHVALPVAAVWLYLLHRLAGRPIRWRVGMVYGGVVAAVLVIAVAFHSGDPHDWNRVGPESGVRYFEPSLARTSSGDFIPAEALANDAYCLQCHADVHAAWSDSAHHFSSFNNPAYFASVVETREAAMKRDGDVQASRWCAGCHDPAPFFSGAFDDPDFDIVNDPTAQAGITCTVCHAITNVNSVRGNADYTIEAPSHYPFAYSENSALQWINRQLIKAKPSFHKKTFLKPFHKEAEFCSVCHKVSLPLEVTGYKEFLRGQNHYDSHLLSGVSGHGVRSFYYPKKAIENCNGCHMPPVPSNDFAARRFGDADQPSVHDHLFAGANTGLAWLVKRDEVIARQQAFLKDSMRVDIFGVREGRAVDGKLHAPLGPETPILEPGKTYIIEVVIRTKALGHHFTQGTGDSNEIWLDIQATADGKTIGRSGGMNDDNSVDQWSHFVNIFMLDKDGRRISRRNAQDIFTPLYNHQIPPGAGQTVHYRLTIPDSVTSPVSVQATLNYRKFDQTYMNFIAESNAKHAHPIRTGELPITELAADTFVFATSDSQEVTQSPPDDFPQWMRWNDYGIGLLLSGKNQLRLAEAAFENVESHDRWDGPLNLARVYESEGRNNDAVAALNRAARYRGVKGFPHWTWAWLSGAVDSQQGNFEQAIESLRGALQYQSAETKERGFDFSRDYVVINLLGETLYDLASKKARQNRPQEATEYRQQAVAEFQRTLTLDPENFTAHYNLERLYRELGDESLSKKHATLHKRFKPDNTARGKAVGLARQRYPAADYAASEKAVVYELQRQGAAELPADMMIADPPSTAATPSE